jgi:broad specificity phosphatase PhoE
MARFAEIRRHSLKGSGAHQNVLSVEGILYAQRVGAGRHDVKYHAVACSTLTRTMQTLAAFMQGHAGITVERFHRVDLLGGREPARWGELVRRANGSMRVEDLLAVGEDLTEALHHLSGTIESIAVSVQDDERALLIGHTPTIELAVHHMTRVAIEPLKELEGVVLRFDASGITLVEELRL